MMYRSTKRYGHECGLSVCFRQHRAESHCALLHGYALAFTFVFEADKLDSRNWVVDFGALAPLRQQLKEMFDHKLLVAGDDPDLPVFQHMARAGVAQVYVVQDVGCEAFARMGYGMAHAALSALGQLGRVRVVSCTVAEHGANSAVYLGEGA